MSINSSYTWYTKYKLFDLPSPHISYILLKAAQHSYRRNLTNPFQPAVMLLLLSSMSWNLPSDCGRGAVFTLGNKRRLAWGHVNKVAGWSASHHDSSEVIHSRSRMRTATAMHKKQTAPLWKSLSTPFGVTVRKIHSSLLFHQPQIACGSQPVKERERERERKKWSTLLRSSTVAKLPGPW